MTQKNIATKFTLIQVKGLLNLSFDDRYFYAYSNQRAQIDAANDQVYVTLWRKMISSQGR